MHSLSHCCPPSRRCEPFPAQTKEQVRQSVLQGARPRELPGSQPGLPAPVAALLQRCWAPDVAARPSFNEALLMLGDLEREMRLLHLGEAWGDAN